MTGVDAPIPTGERVVFISEMSVLPTGAVLDDDDSGVYWDNLRSFILRVQWAGIRQANGYGGYRVTTDGGSRVLSRAGKWAWRPERFRTRQYRFDTLEAAVAAAEGAVDEVKVNGRTWAQWQELFERDARDAEQTAM